MSRTAPGGSKVSVFSTSAEGVQVVRSTRQAPSTSSGLGSGRLRRGRRPPARRRGPHRPRRRFHPRSGSRSDSWASPDCRSPLLLHRPARCGPGSDRRSPPPPGGSRPNGRGPPAHRLPRSRGSSTPWTRGRSPSSRPGGLRWSRRRAPPAPPPRARRPRPRRRAARPARHGDEKSGEIPVGRPLPAPQPLVRQRMVGPRTDEVESERAGKRLANFGGFRGASHISCRRQSIAATVLSPTAVAAIRSTLPASGKWCG